MQNIKENYFKFISGRFGLPITFWFFGVLVAAVLDLLIKNITALWQLVGVTLIVIIHLVLITIAVWNAAKAYRGSRIWSWGAKLAVIAGVAKCLWFLPDLVATFLSAVGMPIHSSDYWVMNPRKFTCDPALYQLTPESIQKRYEGCIYTESANNEVINVRCRSGEMNAEFFYTRNFNDCNKYIEKLRTAKNK